MSVERKNLKLMNRNEKKTYNASIVYKMETTTKSAHFSAELALFFPQLNSNKQRTNETKKFVCVLKSDSLNRG